MKKVFFFSADWCSSCSNGKETVERLCKKHGFEFLLIDIDCHKDLVEDYMINKLPTIVFFKNDIAYRSVENVLDAEAIFLEST